MVMHTKKTKGSKRRSLTPVVGNEEEKVVKKVAVVAVTKKTADGGVKAKVNTKSPTTTNETKKSNKNALPANYICAACKNDPKCGEAHWIHDCPQKKPQEKKPKEKKTPTKEKKPAEAKEEKSPAKRKRETAEKSVSVVESVVEAPVDPKSLFVSGMPFGVEVAAVTGFFSKAVAVRSKARGKSLKGKSQDEAAAAVTSCKLRNFDKQGGRCNGQAVVTFATEAMAEKALKLNNSKWPTTGTEKGEEERVLRIQRAVPLVVKKDNSGDNSWSKKAKKSPATSSDSSNKNNAKAKKSPAKKTSKLPVEEKKTNSKVRRRSNKSMKVAKEMKAKAQ
jgi:RNA recognition motif-containing protein